MIYLRWILILGFPALLSVIYNSTVVDWRFWVVDLYFLITAIVTYLEGFKKGVNIKDEALKKLGGIFTDVKHKIIKK